MSVANAGRWNAIPFVRLLISLIGGIEMQWYLQVNIAYPAFLVLICFLAILGYALLPVAVKYRLRFMSGLLVLLLIFNGGSVLLWCKDVSQHNNWLGRLYREGDLVLITILQPPVEKTNSYLAMASVQKLYRKDSAINVKGGLMISLQKDLPAMLHVGTQLVFKKTLQEINNNGNPGGFDYKRYQFFQGITHQVYLTGKDFERLPLESQKWFNGFIVGCQNRVIETIRKFIPGKREQGLAEALLIGYKNDLDKSLVRSYTNTGVVHVIAISGLHLGLIYWLLMLATKPFLAKGQKKWIRLLIIVISLWLFSIIAGAQPSVLRSAVMFSFIATGDVIERRASVFNTLALSAFVLLCYNPFWLWDIGFQLSYAAVLSILIFFRPVYSWFWFQNKLLDFVWKLNAVTIAAQLLTMPLSIYHFHQLPVLFLFTNIVAVPLSSIILLAEIFISCVFFVPGLAVVAGKLTQWMIVCMNRFIERWDSVPFSVWTGLCISGLQCFLLTVFIVCICTWMMGRKSMLLWVAITSFVIFSAIRSISFAGAVRQKMLVVYNVPKHMAIDIFQGRNATFLGDVELTYNKMLADNYLLPSRRAYRISSVRSAYFTDFVFCGRQVMIIDSSYNDQIATVPKQVDVLILSRYTEISITEFLKNFTIRQLVIDGTVPIWKSKLWKRECGSLGIPCHNVSREGAFVMNL